MNEAENVAPAEASVPAPAHDQALIPARFPSGTQVPADLLGSQMLRGMGYRAPRDGEEPRVVLWLDADRHSLDDIIALEHAHGHRLVAVVHVFHLARVLGRRRRATRSTTITQAAEAADHD